MGKSCVLRSFKFLWWHNNKKIGEFPFPALPLHNFFFSFSCQKAARSFWLILYLKTSHIWCLENVLRSAWFGFLMLLVPNNFLCYEIVWAYSMEWFNIIFFYLELGGPFLSFSCISLWNVCPSFNILRQPGLLYLVFCLCSQLQSKLKGYIFVCYRGPEGICN